MNYWLMKSEPSVFGIEDLEKAPQKTDHWDGVRNYQARNYMRQMKKNDLAFFYHSNCKPCGIVGIMKITREAYPDHTSWDKKSKYFDPKSTKENPRWFMVDVKFYKKFDEMISLDALKVLKGLNDLPLIKKGNRLSIMPIQPGQWKVIENNS